jgi:transcriptional regulator with PAS, ATPase and Fis domain
VQFFLEKYNRIMKKQVSQVRPDVLDTLQRYDFPGNVRELENIVERGVALATSDVLELAQIPEDLRSLEMQTFRKSLGKYASMEEVERAYIEWILKETNFNKTEAAKALGIDRVSLWRKIKKMGLE